MSKLRDEKWHDLPRQSRLARLMYPQLMEPQFRGEVAAMSKSEGKRLPVEPQPTSQTSRSSGRVYVLPPGFHRANDRRR